MIHTGFLIRTSGDFLTFTDVTKGWGFFLFGKGAGTCPYTGAPPHPAFLY